MRRLTKIGIAAAAVLAAGASLAAVGAAGQRRQIAPAALVVDVTTAAPALRARTWRRPSPEEASFRRAASIWWSDAGGALYEEVSRHANVFAAYDAFLSDNPRKRYERDFPHLVRSVAPPDVRVDRVDMFCGNVQRSHMPDLEDCAIWGAMAQIGQYTFYLVRQPYFVT